MSEGGREWKNFCDLGKLVNAKFPSCKGLRMGVHRNEEAAHSNLISFHQHLVDQTIIYSLAYLVVPNTEEQFSQPFLGLSKIWQLFQDPIII